MHRCALQPWGMKTGSRAPSRTQFSCQRKLNAPWPFHCGSSPGSAGWPGLNLLEPAKPVLHVIGADDPAVHDLVEVVRPYLGLATGRRDAEELAGVDAAHLGAHADHSVSLFAASVDDLFDDGAEVAEGLVEPFDQVPRPGAAGLLAGPQRDVVPVV